MWIPGMAMVVVGAAHNCGPYIQIGLIFCGIQPIISTCMAMTKSDVKKYTTRLITLSYVRISLTEETDTDNINDSS
jgi:hypothetical protein